MALLWVKFFIAICIAVAGIDMTMNATMSMTTLWLMIPGLSLLIIGAPLCAYYYTKIRAGHGSKNDQEILRQAELEVRSSDGKK